MAEIVFPELMGALIDKANSNPYGENLDGFIFYATVPQRPSDSKVWLADLREVCEKIGIKNTEKNKLPRMETLFYNLYAR